MIKTSTNDITDYVCKMANAIALRLTPHSVPGLCLSGYTYGIVKLARIFHAEESAVPPEGAFALVSEAGHNIGLPMPNCTEEFGTSKIEFGRLGQRVVEGKFNGGRMTSDAGVMLLGTMDRKLGLIETTAHRIADPRSPLLIKHDVADMRQRVYALALGWKDLNVHGAPRQDVAMQTAVGVDREAASAPTQRRLESWADRATAWRLHEVPVD